MRAVRAQAPLGVWRAVRSADEAPATVICHATATEVHDGLELPVVIGTAIGPDHPRHGAVMAASTRLLVACEAMQAFYRGTDDRLTISAVMGYVDEALAAVAAGVDPEASS